ncbi:HD-GYP domain-containing protein [Thalassotalea ganghwensis]
MLETIDINELCPGHFVVNIVNQTGNYKLTKAGHIKNELVVKNLVHKGVLQVQIDTSKTKTFSIGQLDYESQTFVPDISKTSAVFEIDKAKAIFNQSKKIQRKVFNDAFSGKPIDIKPVHNVTEQTIDAIFKNPDALACIINLRNKDEYLLEHSVSVSVLMTIFAKYLKIEKSIIQDLAIGAFLHDVGKIMVPEEILNKPGKLTEEEFTVMKTHVNHSIDIIEATEGISPLSLEVARLHHEKLDGSGYPFSVPGKDISTYGRMITICDIFDALTAHRCYKDGYSHMKAFSILKNLADSGHLDTRLVNLFINCMGIFPVGSLVELKSNKLAIVEKRNVDVPTKPKVKVFYSPKHHHYVEAKQIDLAKSNDTIIKGVRADEFDLDMNKIIDFLLTEA